MHSKKSEGRIYFAIEVDIFRYIATYYMLCEQKGSQTEEGVVHNDKYKEQRKKLYGKDEEQKGNRK
ncbi:hypothetical protein EJB10_02500 [Wolbachia endosymbiont of Brugia malayi]|uniref:hypothetical protein n=1 Tax=unclassified Wolbachia TaxID=2640676 RepID=UPI00004C926B|nr:MULTISPECIES: hypothetical protein [unclassified Wolbachia]AAW70682.1 Predicted protein [Wolbachia endosymbiont strain TRS of Brugia malayi]QCB61665.1 hypothetical protein EJB10_02500 [Wolbachia endosymbiont of Brugia malayi]QIT36126.1 hypothetical protein WBP_0957 [Wolbachia endosymbiont of Brugia pahangi]